MRLDRAEIEKCLTDGRIHYPYAIEDSSIIQDAQIDVAIGDQFWEPVGSDRRYSSVGMVMYPNEDGQDQFVKLDPISLNGKTGLYLRAGVTYLALTKHEFGTAKGSGIVPDLRARSSAGRFGFTVAKCAGVGDVGYCGRWVCEIQPSMDTFLLPGSVIAQVVFTATTSYGTPTDIDYKAEGAYMRPDGTVRVLPKAIRVI